MILGASLHTFHSAPVPCDVTAGIYVQVDQITGGVLRNSECRPAAFLAWTPETNTLTILSIPVKAGLMLGGIAGYERHPLLPLVAPSVAAEWRHNFWFRATYLPKPPQGRASGVHISLEFDL